MASDFGDFFEVDGISISDIAGIFAGSFDPSIAGQSAPSGSIFLRTDVPEVHHKSGLGDTAWIRLNSDVYNQLSGDIAALSGNISNLSGEVLDKESFLTSLYIAKSGAGSPSAGEVRWNSFGAQSSSNLLRIHNNTSSGMEAQYMLGSLEVGNKILITERRSSTQHQLWEITSIIVGANYYDFGLTLLSDTGGNFVDSEDIKLSFLTTTSVSGGVSVIDDLLDVDTTTSAPTDGDRLIWYGLSGLWIPESAAPPTLPVESSDFIYSFDTTTQTVVAINTWQDVTFSNTNQFDGWTHTAGTAIFTAGRDGRYAATVEFNVEKNGGGNVEAAIRSVINGIEIEGSHNGMDITSNNTAFSLSRTFLFNITNGQQLKMQFAANNTTARIIPPPSPGGVATEISATMTIRRLT